MLWNLINVCKVFDILGGNKLQLFFMCESMKQEAWEWGFIMKVVIKSFTRESTPCSRKYLPFQVSTTVLRRQEGFKGVLNLCVLWPRNHPTAVVFTGLITPTLKWGSSYLTTGHLWRNYFLMMCGMKWFGFLLFSSHEQ